MTIENQTPELPLRPISYLMGKVFHIPYQQRGYKWTSNNVYELLKDLKDFIDNPNPTKRVYCLQPLALVKIEEDKYSVLDGQQRLTTLNLLLRYLGVDNPFSFEFERDETDSNREVTDRSTFLRDIATATAEEADSNIDFFYIYNAFNKIYKTFEKWDKDEDERKSKDPKYLAKDYRKLFLELLRADNDAPKTIQVIWYQVPEIKKYDTFRNLNSGKIQLSNTELIKALLLNSVSGLPENERMEAAAQFEMIEREMQNDHFWYMLNTQEVGRGQTRMDLLFNLVAGCKQSDYDIDPRWSFRSYFDKDNNGSLSDKWRAVRHTFLRLKDLYDDIYCYHYIGVLTYHSGHKGSLAAINRLLNDCRKLEHSKLITKLKDRIKKILVSAHSSVDEFTYNDPSTKPLRLLFLMHNVETILQKYENLKGAVECERLMRDFDHFPFDLLHRQNWDIEHIASQSECDFTKDKDRQDWLKSVKEDMGTRYDAIQKIKELETAYISNPTEGTFKPLYKAVIKANDAETKNSIPDEAPNGGKDKSQVGNLTLLDSHTNRSYHNALFPRKRHYIIASDGLADITSDFDAKITKMFIPPCTRQVFTKAYTKGASLSLNNWTQIDADAYQKDIEQKLEYYFRKDIKK